MDPASGMESFSRLAAGSSRLAVLGSRRTTRPSTTTTTTTTTTTPLLLPPPPPQPTMVKIEPTSRRGLVWETRFVMAAFLVPAIGAAIVPLGAPADGVSDINRFPTLVSDPLLNMILGMIEYVGLVAVVPVALLLRTRTGTRREPWVSEFEFLLDIWPGIGLAVLSYLAEIVVLIPLAAVSRAKNLVISPAITSVPHYYVIYGLFTSAVTAITEEVIVNGYLLVRLEQLGWLTRSALSSASCSGTPITPTTGSESYSRSRSATSSLACSRHIAVSTGRSWRTSSTSRSCSPSRSSCTEVRPALWLGPILDHELFATLGRRFGVRKGRSIGGRKA